MARLNTLVKNVTVVRPETGADGGEQLDIGITDGTFSRLEPNIPAEDADVVVDGRGLLAFPGVVDGHQHWGIYNSLEDDTDTESRASAQGGVTTGLTYMRTGQYYLNTGGPYREFFPKVLAASEGRSFIDYAFHLAPMSREQTALRERLQAEEVEARRQYEEAVHRFRFLSNPPVPSARAAN